MVLLAREFGWTPQDIRELYPSELAVILEELKQQKEVYEYNEFRNKWAFLAAAFTNAVINIVSLFSKRKPKQVVPDDFMDKEWHRKIEKILKEAQPPQDDKWVSFIEEAKTKGLKGPW